MAIWDAWNQTWVDLMQGNCTTRYTMPQINYSFIVFAVYIPDILYIYSWLEFSSP